MAKDPAFLFYSGDFLTGVADLTFEERGQYITLLALQHQKGHLTEKAIRITIPNVSEDVLAKFKIDKDGNYYNERLELEALKRSEHSRKQKERAEKGWEKRKRQSYGNATANATALPLENEDENEDVVKDYKGVAQKKSAIPTLEQFVDYGLEQASKHRLNVTRTSLSMKYEAWVNNDWKSGTGVDLSKNWKSSLINTLKYIQEEQKKDDTPKTIADLGLNLYKG